MTKDGFGQSPRRLEDGALLRGAGTFTADMNLDGQGHMVVLRSPHGHADITALDITAAATMPGVLAVLTGAEADSDGLADIAGGDDGLKNRDGSDSFTPSRPVIAQGRVRYVGEPVALVVAATLAEARDAAEQIEVDYAPLAAVGDIAAATAPGAPLIWDQAPGNVSLDWQGGDAAATDQAFAAAAHITEVDLVDNRVMVFPMEPATALGVFGRHDGRYTLHAPTQGVHGIRTHMAHVLGVDEQAVRVLTPHVGGAFGMRGTAAVEQALVLWASKRTGRPVKWVAERGEAILSDLAARDHLSHAAMALDGDGRMLAVKVHTRANIGAYVTPFARNSPTVGYAAALSGTYDLPAFHVRCQVVFTNTIMTHAYRGAGRPEGIYITERLIDKAALELGIAADDLRRRNLVPATAMPYATVTGETYDSGDFTKNLDDASAMARLERADDRRQVARQSGKRYGVGISNYVKINGGTPREAARIAFDSPGDDGAEPTITLYIGTQENGQGHGTTYGQIIAEELGLPLDAIHLVQGDSDAVVSGRGTGGSSAFSVGGVAAMQSARKIVEAGMDTASELLEAATGDIEFAEGRYTVAGTDRSVALTDVARSAAEAGRNLDESADYTAAAKTFANGCHICEVEVDVETGQVEIVGYTVADDIGRVINPMLAEGQVHGGLAQGVGQALVEHSVHDDTGQVLTGSLMDYGLPRADHFPSFRVAFSQIPCTTNALAVKGVGEAGTTGALPAVVNAVVDALKEFGVDHIDMPVTPERVWRAINRSTNP
jgi:aerobic carbon-monoxide dehydrogenase large subunit